MNVRTVGTGRPALVFVHGFGCGLEDWDAQVAELSSDFTCVALDLPGHGGSPPPGEATMAAMAAAVNAVRRGHGTDPAILVGHSLGAKVIREAYRQDGAGVAGLVLIDGAFYDGDRATLVARAAAAIDADGFAAYGRRHFADMFVPGSDPALRERVLQRMLRLDPAFGRALYLEAVGWDPLHGRDTLARIAVPTLVLQATDLDAHFRRRMLHAGMTTPFTRLVTQLAVGSEAAVIEGAGHFPMTEAPGAVNAALRRFAARVAAGLNAPPAAWTGPRSASG